MTTRVVGEHEVSLNGVRFPINGKVRSSIASSYAPSQRRFSTLEWRDPRAGMGTTRIGPEGPFTVCADTSWDIRHAGHLMTGGIIDESDPSLATGGGSGVTLLNELVETLVTTAGVEIYSFVDDSGWTNRLVDTTGTPRSIKNGNLGGTEHCVIPFTTGYSHASVLATWANVDVSAITSHSVNFVEFWDDKMWGISGATGQLWYTTTITPSADADLVDTARVFLNKGELVTGLFKARS